MIGVLDGISRGASFFIVKIKPFLGSDVDSPSAINFDYISN